ncbi:MAG: hypothetical protein ACHQSE_08105 [Gemmatimonadales bacterium]
MAMTLKRWIGACVLGCLALAVALLPPQAADDTFYRWTPRWSGREQGLNVRVEGRYEHAHLLWVAYRHAHDAGIAQHEFASKPGTTAGDVSVWFDADVPEATRREVGEALNANESERGSWRGKGRVGVLVFTDTATSIDGVHLPWGYNRGLIVSTKVLPPTPATGDRCVTVIRVGHVALHTAGAIPPDRALLDGCAFYDAFGQPGPHIAAWMDSTHAGFARALSFAPPDSTSITLSRWGYDDFFYGDERFARCAASDLAACSAMVKEPAVNFFWRFWHDASVPAPAEATEDNQRARGFSATLLDAMVRDIGPERFERVWQSQKSLDSAFFDATGEPLGAWVHRRTVAIHGPYHIGPLPTATSAILTIVTIVLSLALSARFAQRPAAA